MLFGIGAPNLITLFVTNETSEKLAAVEVLVGNEVVKAAGIKNIQENTNKVTGISTLTLNQPTTIAISIDGSAPIVVAEKLEKHDCYNLNVFVSNNEDGTYNCRPEVAK